MIKLNTLENKIEDKIIEAIYKLSSDEKIKLCFYLGIDIDSIADEIRRKLDNN